MTSQKESQWNRLRNPPQISPGILQKSSRHPSGILGISQEYFRNPPGIYMITEVCTRNLPGILKEAFYDITDGP